MPSLMSISAHTRAVLPACPVPTTGRRCALRVSLAFVLLATMASAGRAQFRPSTAAEQQPAARFTADPVADAAIISVALGFGALSELVVTTGEIVPQQPQPTSRLLAIDHLALTKHESSAGPSSSIAAFAMLAYAVVDPIASGYREGLNSGIVDATIYAEALALTWAATNLAKLTVRRPRPRAYQEQERAHGSIGRTYEHGDVSGVRALARHRPTVDHAGGGHGTDRVRRRAARARRRALSHRRDRRSDGWYRDRPAGRAPAPRRAGATIALGRVQPRQRWWTVRRGRAARPVASPPPTGVPAPNLFSPFQKACDRRRHVYV